jgi:hypothetical protein
MLREFKNGDDPRPIAGTRLTTRSLAVRWGTSIKSVVALINAGKLQAFNVAPGRGRRWRIPLEEILEFEERQRCPAAPAPPRRRRRVDDDVIEFFPKPR